MYELLRCTSNGMQARHRTPETQNRAACIGIRVMYHDALRAMPLLYSQTRNSILWSRKLVVEFWAADNDRAKSASVYVSILRQPTSPEHAQWLVRSLVDRYRPCKFLED